MTTNNDDVTLPSPSDGTVKKSHDDEIERILVAMLDADEDITARGVVKRHSGLSAASSITRNPARSELLSRYQEKQDEMRGWRKRLAKRSRDDSAMSMAEKDIRIAELERQVALLTASHVAMIRAVGELGGFSKWSKFFDGYQEVREELRKMGAMPEASVTRIGE